MRRTVVAVALGVLWITTFGLLDALSPAITFFGSLSIAAVGVSLFAPARVAFLVWVYAFAWNLYAGVDGVRWSSLHFLRLGISAFVGGSAIAIAVLRERREHRMQVVTDVAVTAQRALLRVLPARIGGVGVEARYVSAAEEALVGGDFYEVAPTPHGVRVIIGDVAGRGLPAVSLAGLVLGGFREAALSAPDLGDLARRLDATVRAYVSGDEYATAALVELRGREARFVSCGHPLPLLLDGGHEPLPLALPTSLPLGYGAEPDVVARTLREGERILLYTDGLSEARDAAGRFFDVRTDGAAALANGDPAAALDGLLGDLVAHLDGRLEDDVALVLLEPAER